MSPAELVAWQKRHGLRTDAEAASALGISAGTYWRHRKGKTPIRPQTELCAFYYETLFAIGPLRLAEAGDAINKIIRVMRNRR
jgi:hypothetical protein